MLLVGPAILGLRVLSLYQAAYLVPPLPLPLLQREAIHLLFRYPHFEIVLFPPFVVLAVILQRRGPFLDGVVMTLLRFERGRRYRSMSVTTFLALTNSQAGTEPPVKLVIPAIALTKICLVSSADDSRWLSRETHCQ